MKTKDYNFLPDNALLRIDEVLMLTGIGKTRWYAGIKEGIFPPQIKIGKRARAWTLGSIKKLIADMAKGGVI